MTLQTTLLMLTNNARAQAGVPPLRVNPSLQQIAQNHAATMAREGYFDHIDTQGRGVGERLLAAGYNYRWAGENISAGKQCAEDVMQWWLTSESHRANLLKAEFTETGFGYRHIEHDRLSFHHYWVQVFAAPLEVNKC